MSSGKNMENGFYFEVNEGRTQLSITVTYDEKYDKFNFEIYTGTFDWPPDTKHNSWTDDGDVDRKQFIDQCSNRNMARQSFTISRGKARILLNTKFWEAITKWSEKMKEIEKVVEEKRRALA